MKKIIALLLTFILLIPGSAIVFADENSDTLSAVGILPTFSGGGTSPVTRGEFAYMAARLIGAEEAPKATRFNDVNESHVYSGYIEYLAAIGVVAGNGDGTFAPDDYATYGMAAKILINVLGYNEFGAVYGGYAEGYTEVLSKLGLNKGVNLASDKILTVDNAVKLIHNALTMNINSVSYYKANGSVNAIMTSDKKASLLASVFGISVYEGNITDVNDAGTYISVLITKNKYDSNPVKLTNGQTVTFELGEGISGDEYLNVPAILWVDEDSKVIQVKPQRDVEIKYVQIATVNNTKKNYPISNINSMTFLDDETEYDVAETATLRYNGMNNVSTTEELIGKFAKVVVQDDEIVFIESWDLIDGGLITNTDGNTITYIKNGKTTYLRDLANVKKVVTIIGTNGAKINEVKAGSVFMYYIRDGYAVVVASEKKIVDVFTSISASNVVIGEAAYGKKKISYTENGAVESDSELLYFSEDGVIYNNTNYISLLDRTVEAYIGPDGYVWFIKALNADSSRKEFYGVVNGYEVDNLDPEFGQIEVVEIGDTFTTSRYDLTDKTVYNDGLSLVTMATEAKEKALKGTGIYKFEVSASGKLVSVSMPDPIYGFNTTSTTVTSFGTTACVSLAPNYIYWSSAQKILVIYENNDKLAFAWTTWTALYQQTSSSPLNMHFFGEGTSITPDLVVLTGGSAPISQMGSEERYGIITNIMDALDENGDTVKELSVIMKSGNKKYLVSPETLVYKNSDGQDVSITKNTIIKFRDDVRYGSDDIVLLDSYIKPLDKNHENWETDWTEAIVEGADASRLIISGFGSIAFHPNLNFIVKYDADAPTTQFTLASWSDIDEGDTVFYNNKGDGTRGVIIIK